MKAWRFLTISLGVIMAMAISMSDLRAEEEKPARVFPKFEVEEYWLVRDGKIDDLVAYIRDYEIPILREIGGFAGWTVKTHIPEEGGASTFGRVALGTPGRLIVPHPGVNLDGVRTDRSVNLHALIEREYNVITVLYFSDEKAMTEVLPKLEKAWKDKYGVSVYDDQSMQDNLFRPAINHWDVVYRIMDSDILSSPAEKR